MAKYGPKAQAAVQREMKAMEQGKLRSGSGQKVTDRKQAIAIALSEARKAGAKMPPPPEGSASQKQDAAHKRAARKTAAKKSAAKKAPAKKTPAKKTGAAKKAAPTRKSATKTTTSKKSATKKSADKVSKKASKTAAKKSTKR